MKILGNVTDELEANVVVAKDQEQYVPLPAHIFPDGMVCCCLELSDEELKEIAATGKLYVSHLTFNTPLQPFFVTGKQETFKEHINQYQK